MLKKLSIITGSSLLAVIISLFVAHAAHAATYTVDSIDDGGNTGGAGVCDNGGGKCTLRAAIEAVNADLTPGVINFNIPGGGVHTLTPATPLNISEQVTIDGSSQPGASCGTLVPANLPGSNTPHSLLIEIDGTNAIDGFGGGVIQLTSAAASSTVIKGLVINRATTSNGFAIHYGVNDINNVTIECNYLGTDSTGSTASPNARGIGTDTGFDNTGLTIQNNLISGNSDNDIFVVGTGTTNNMVIQNNLIGTDATGTSSISSSSSPAIRLQNLNTIQVNHNIVSGNGGVGIDFDSSTNITVQDDYVGLNVLAAPLGNTGDGIQFFGATNMTIGGVSATNRNIVSANTGDGIHIYRNCNASSNSTNSTTFNNYIGTNASGVTQSGYGNGGAGIEVNEYYGGCVSVYNHQIGGDSAGQANIIAGNTNQGVLVHQIPSVDVFSVSVLNNVIYGNGQFGIDLAADSADDGTADTDLGPNPLNALAIEYPTTVANYYLNTTTINSATYIGNQVTVNYNYQAPSVTDNPPYIQSSNVVGYRLDFYINDGQDGAYAGYAQGKNHLGSFIVNGSETNATHTFTSPVSLTNGQVVTATATVLWQNIPDPGTNCQGDIWGAGPPYQTTCI